MKKQNNQYENKETPRNLFHEFKEEFIEEMKGIIKKEVKGYLKYIMCFISGISIGIAISNIDFTPPNQDVTIANSSN